MDWLPPAPPSAPCWGSSPPPQRAPRLGIEGLPVGAWDDTHHEDTPAGPSIRFAVDSTLTSLKLSYLSCKLISLFKQMVCEQLPNAHSQPLPVRLHLGCKSLTHGRGFTSEAPVRQEPSASGQEAYAARGRFILQETRPVFWPHSEAWCERGSGGHLPRASLLPPLACGALITGRPLSPEPCQG